MVYWKSCIQTVLAAMLLTPALAAPQAEITGTAWALDGDTLEIGAVRVRLFGIDAPETGQTCETESGAEWPCGAAATERLAVLVGSGQVACTARDRDRFGRVVADCRNSAGVDLGGRLVAEGLAWAYARYSMEHVEAENHARAEGLGIWQGAAQVASEFRAEGGWVSSSGLLPPGDCAIKGNISTSGERIYHTPGTRYYDRTHISEARGQRWFCNTEEAEAAGWRPAGSR